MNKQTITLNIDALKSIPSDILNQPGCYMLYSNQWEKGITRFNNIDSKGTLYIGKADLLGNRVSSLITSVLSNSKSVIDGPKEKGHKTLSRKFYRIRELVEIDSLLIDLFPLPGIDSKILESYLLEKYVAIFGELPPLNGQYGSFSLDQATSFLKEVDFPFEDYKII